jgi:hypothetical protein
MTPDEMQAIAEKVAAHKALPPIITGPGDYRTRDGRRVTIHEVAKGKTHAATGAIWTLFRGKLRPRGYRGWELSGRSMLHERPSDIVGPWVEPQQGDN